MSKKLTPWFPAHVKPVRKGVYMTLIAHNEFGRIERYQYWDGGLWGGYATFRDHAAQNRHYPSEYQNPNWRGLAEKP